EVPPPVVFEELLVDGTSVPFEGIVRIPAGAEKLEFRYTALSFRNPSRVVMRYQLEGYEREWVDAGTRRTAFYTSLPPGPYRFMVNAGNEDGVWNDDGAGVEVHIEPHFNQTPFFYVLCALAVLGGAAGLHRFRVRHLRRREQELERRVEKEVAKHQREEERRRKLEAQLLEAQKVESLGILAGGIAHQFNNLLVGILGNVDLALMKLSPSSQARVFIEQIEKAGLRAADLAAQMLAFSGKGRLVSEPVDLSYEVKEMADLLAASTSKKVRLAYALASDLPAIDADVTQIRQLVMNLVINASEAIGDAEGTITVTTGTMVCDREYLSATHLNEDLLAGACNYIEIADSGCGMDKDTRAKLFEPFFSTKFTGRGLGLAVVLGIARSHQGAVKVESEPYRGSKIRVLFPCSSQPPAPAAADASTSKPEWRGSGTVLLVDDEEPVRLTAQAMLETLGFEVLTAADGCECVETYRRHRDEIRLVMLDNSMPRMGGVEAFRELRRLHSDARVVLCSGYSEREVTEGLAGDHLDGFLHKPYQLDTLREKIRGVLDPERNLSKPTE
ncbi:MAG: response regulator, partial [bacterium]|nr:response regulator [bacterium]